jgi:hypothetical protein
VTTVELRLRPLAAKRAVHGLRISFHVSLTASAAAIARADARGAVSQACGARVDPAAGSLDSHCGPHFQAGRELDEQTGRRNADTPWTWNSWHG